MHGAIEAAAHAQVDVQAALDWRDFMVSNHSDAGQERWLAEHGIDLLRDGRSGLAELGCTRAQRAARWRRLCPRVRRRERAPRGLSAGRDGTASARRGDRPGNCRRRSLIPDWIKVDEYMRAGERLWAIGDATGIWPLTHVGEYEGDVVAANIAGAPITSRSIRKPAITADSSTTVDT